MPDGYTVMNWDDFERMEGSGGANWLLARKSMGISAFGINMIDIEAGGQIPEHDESESGQEEVYAVLDGEGTFIADGEEIPAPAGTFIRYAPETSRTIRNNSDSIIRAMVIGVPMSSGYEPMSWG